MAIIIGIRAHFEKAWTAAYVPALLMYGERSKKRVLKDIFSDMMEAGVYSLVPRALHYILIPANLQ